MPNDTNGTEDPEVGLSASIRQSQKKWLEETADVQDRSVSSLLRKILERAQEAATA